MIATGTLLILGFVEMVATVMEKSWNFWESHAKLQAKIDQGHGILKYRKFSNKGASPNKGAPSFLRGTLTQNLTFLAISQPKMVRFSFCKRPLEAENVIYSTISLLTRPAPLLENLR